MWLTLTGTSIDILFLLQLLMHVEGVVAFAGGGFGSGFGGGFGASKKGYTIVLK
jgi:hypothetical protein